MPKCCNYLFNIRSTGCNHGNCVGLISRPLAFDFHIRNTSPNSGYTTYWTTYGHLNYTFTDTVRERFFNSKLQHLRKAATSGFDSLHAMCETVQTAIDSQYPVIPCVADVCQLQCLPQHKFSQELLPDEFRLKLIPLQTLGDGNCLYRYVSYSFTVASQWVCG